MNNFPAVKIFATTGSQILAKKIHDYLLKDSRLPESIFGKTEVKWFSNQNAQIQIDNVRDHFIVVIHTQAPPVSDGIIELFALLDAISNARPADILLVFPYMPYSRSDRKNKPRISTMGRRLPHILTHSFGIKRVILLDPHDTHIKHYFDPAADEISATYLIVDYFKKWKKSASLKIKQKTVVVFADAGAVAKYEKVAHLLDFPSAYIDKDRPGDDEKPKIKRIVGDIENRVCILIDDEILTGGTAIGDAKILLDEGAQQVSFMAAIHAGLTSKELTKKKLINNLASSSTDHFVVTDSIPYSLSNLGISSSKFTVLSVAPLLAEAIKRSVKGESLTELHKLENTKLYCQ